jgi:phospholipid/cholesterol/gamma-HCH transport system permease protein
MASTADIAISGPPPGGKIWRNKRARTKVRKVSTAANEALRQTGEMTELLAKVVKSAILHPRGYWGDVREQMYDILRLCWFPVIVSTTAFGFGTPGLQGGNIFLLFGIPERLGSFFLMASVREFAPWINAMVVAGVMGTAITADLGARRIREEFDAMEVLGIDPIRDVILPRVVAMTIMTGLLDVVALSFGVLGGLCAEVELNASPVSYFANFWNNATTTDMLGSVSKTFLFGLIIGVVCCYKGYRAEGGPIGVGRAVNQAVVVAFAGIWAFNWSFTQIMLGLNPDMQVYR